MVCFDHREGVRFFRGGDDCGGFGVMGFYCGADFLPGFWFEVYDNGGFCVWERWD